MIQPTDITNPIFALLIALKEFLVIRDNRKNFNSAGFPASSFRTNDWKGVTVGNKFQ